MIAKNANPATWARGERWSFLVLLIGMCITLVWTVHPYYDAGNDAAVYIVTTRSLLDGEGYSYHGSPVIIRPPGFSYMLAPVMAAFGTDFVAFNTVTSLFGILGVAMLFALFRNRLGALLTFSLCAAIWLNPFYQRLSAKVMSDVPGAALLIVCLVLERWSRRSPSRGRYVLLGLTIAAAMYVRTLNGLLVPATAAAYLVEFIRFRDDQRVKAAFRGLVWVVVLPLLAYTPLLIRNANAQIPVPTEQFAVHSYTTAMLHQAPGDPNSPLITFADLKERLASQTEKMLPLLGNRMGPAEFGAVHWAFGLFGILCWLVVLVRNRGPTEFFCGILLVILVVYFEFEPRLALPLYLLLLAMCAQALLWAVRWAAGQKAGPVILSVALLALCVVDFDGWSWKGSVARRHQAYVELKDYIDTRFPGDAPLAAPNGRHYGVFLERPVYTLNIAALRSGFQGVRELIRKYRVAAMIVSSSDPLEKKHIAPFRSTFRLEKKVGPFHVFLGPGTAGRRAKK